MGTRKKSILDKINKKVKQLIRALFAYINKPKKDDVILYKNRSYIVNNTYESFFTIRPIGTLANETKGIRTLQYTYYNYDVFGRSAFKTMLLFFLRQFL